MILQLSPAIPVRTPKGLALAHAIIDYGIESDLHWVCFQDNTGECLTWRNQDIRSQKNVKIGRENITPYYNPKDVAFKNCNYYKKTRCMGCGANEEQCHEYSYLQNAWFCDDCWSKSR